MFAPLVVACLAQQAIFLTRDTPVESAIRPVAVASQPVAEPDADEDAAETSIDTAEPDEVVNDEAGELWKLQELDATQTAPPQLEESNFPKDDLEVAKGQTSIQYRAHPE